MSIEKEKRGFIQNGTRKLFQDKFDNCAYLYTDGIVLNEKRTCKSGKETFKKEFHHIFPCNIPVLISNHRNPDERFIGRLVIHNTTLLIDGIDHVQIYFNNQSERSKEMGIHIDTIILYTQSGMEIRENIFNFISSDVVIQNESKQSITSWDSMSGDTIWHGDKPVVEKSPDEL